MLTAKTMADLLAAIYKREGWVRVAGESKTARAKTKYDLALDHKKNIFTARIKAQA